MEARAAQVRSLALQRCVQGAGAWAGCGVEDLATHCDVIWATWRGIQYTLLFVNKMINHMIRAPRGARREDSDARRGAPAAPGARADDHFSSPAFRFLSFSA